MNWWWFAVGAILIVALGWWLLIRTEGVYLGKRVVIWLYDFYATRYDAIVQLDDVDEHLYLAQPLMTRIQPLQSPLVLDVATGTGRLPLALCQHAAFAGHVIGSELSAGMLRQAVAKIEREHFHEFVSFSRADAHSLPFPDRTFDVVTCLEALEFMAHPEQALQEMYRVLKPDGLILTTQRINEPFMPGKLWDTDEMTRRLTDAGFAQIEFEEWQLDYTQVWCRKSPD
jgi:ubiquinone/menaquinone biosynthesis C-methylase UbiE